MRTTLPTLLAITLLAACSKANPYYCEGNPDNNCTIDADINAPQDCTASAQCSNPAKPVCDVDQKLCVACTDDEAGSCGGTSPVCTSANTCAPCAAHTECDSLACLPNGACGDDTTVAYVATGGDNGGACTQAAPCASLAVAAMKGRPYVKVQNNLDEAVVLDTVNVTILAAPLTRLTRTVTQGPILEVRGQSNVAIEDLLIQGGGGTTGHGVYVAPGQPANVTLDNVAIVGNGGNGINVQGGTLKMRRCLVSANVTGGAVVSAPFDITNSMFVSNGTTASTTGGLTLTPSGTDVFRYNTIAYNSSSSGSVTVRGINCTVPLTISSSIISNNMASTSCSFEYSLFDASTTVSGTNRAGDARFKNIDAVNPMAADFFRIAQNSDAIDHGDPSVQLMTDLDGDARPQGTAPDIGADEFK
jgi:hypothetical protein